MNKICKEPLFDFHLDLIEDCQFNHDDQGKISTCWFYLTCGYYRIAADHDLLLNYSNSLVDQWEQNPSTPDDYFFRTLKVNYSSYVDYYVARLWEDLIEMLYIISEPLPRALESTISNPVEWAAKAQDWLDNQPEDNDEAWDIYYQGTCWLGNRRLYNGYLNSSSEIYIYLSENGLINLVWDNRDREIDNLPAWSAQYGKFSLPEKEFFEEIQSFNDSLIKKMGERIEWIRNNWKDLNKYADLEPLREEHKMRSDHLSEGLKRPINKENFDKVYEAIEKMDIGYGV